MGSLMIGWKGSLLNATADTPTAKMKIVHYKQFIALFIYRILTMTSESNEAANLAVVISEELFELL